MTALEKLSGLRMSSLADCARKAVLEATNDPERPWDRLELGWLWRGRRVGQDWVLFVATEHEWTVWPASGSHEWVPTYLRAGSAESADIIAEVPVRWAYGVGHADAWIKETDTLVEVVSSASGASHQERKFRQLTGYLMHYTAEVGALVTVNPSNMVEEDRLILRRNSATFQQAEAEMRDRIAGLNGRLPERVCSKPAQARGHFCRFQTACFGEDWQPDPIQPCDEEGARMIAAELYLTKESKRRVDAEAKILDQQRRQLEDALGEIIEPGEWAVGPLTVKRTVVPRTSFDLKAAQASLPAGVLDPYVKVSTSSRYTLTRNGDGPLLDADDFGPVPF